MFVSRKKYQKVVAELATVAKVSATNYRQGMEWRALALEQGVELDRIRNELNMSRTAHANREQLPQDLIRSLLVLCHPDKHGGKESAVRATQQLLKLRK